MSIAAHLHRLAQEVRAHASDGARAVYLDESLAGDERPVRGEADALALKRAYDRGERGFVALATGATGIEIYTNAALAARVLKGLVPVRVRWGASLGVNAAALALCYGADELCGPLAARDLENKIAIIGGPPEDPARPSARHVEALIRGSGRSPLRRRA